MSNQVPAAFSPGWNDPPANVASPTGGPHRMQRFKRPVDPSIQNSMGGHVPQHHQPQQPMGQQAMQQQQYSPQMPSMSQQPYGQAQPTNTGMQATQFQQFQQPQQPQPMGGQPGAFGHPQQQFGQPGIQQPHDFDRAYFPGPNGSTPQPNHMSAFTPLNSGVPQGR
ncbi:hypothetical protein M3Y99_01506800 [Aphelenchoides fujianensis]|nr:hypothetical protein M3Y99_01506800 [Aphelenchoides fujianensis]